ncbi:hypothetical protein GUJ93_ZPchr0010g8694 [Zizania palustris]|uniref:Uncharacterized protein n=1 Tax=Zizania palustris TaxID=103762 RepID=A0A8J6BCH4_ZIZPA|nr:hypothetical protein GUJ93_ZPchr0010g8694 [Zizania palustris]
MGPCVRRAWLVAQVEGGVNLDATASPPWVPRVGEQGPREVDLAGKPGGAPARSGPSMRDPAAADGLGRGRTGGVGAGPPRAGACHRVDTTVRLLRLRVKQLSTSAAAGWRRVQMGFFFFPTFLRKTSIT